ncbi:CocE/NonD family hydrolase [Pseudoxanthomonas winnipegensis]|jgi:putative CocE/NonD family hydrolase|uniref:CocE/NonD family hydrolase n=1 Tax=Pseudoxanthomonas winnipegensis TaxID=2480810 RepID=A0ABY1WBI3_9GAMM|nr:CocE/NonD family hydrolase [Pseudoxanthomonas winnipegensis]TAA10941.1 CocE/NonD family hydrolase [Pseudoxanthomonas winnipegensis]TAA18367.1 CocE/NonD family hydrolase [Pseudoxanthomonas winnipegensis]TAH74259.1 CocE/NonD family hydrolase [Pseudoxanthomonas winnipegensis]
MILSRLRWVAFAGLLACCIGWAAPPGQAATDAAAALIPLYEGASQPDDLVTLYRLQLSAGRYGAAEATLEKLGDLYRSVEPRRVPALVPWQLYARAKGHEAKGQAPGEALAQAFNELVASLPDDRIAPILPAFQVDLDALQAEEAKQARACPDPATARCAAPEALIAAREATAAWRFLLPASETLLKADLERRFSMQRVLIPTPDGARIDALLVRQHHLEGARLTALLNFTIYARDDWALDDAVQMAGRGYMGVVAFTRGKGRGSSPGPVVPYVHDGRDADTLIDWLSRQAWSDGRVGMFSGSYNGFTQWAAAKHRPPALKALATHATNAPGIDTPMQGGVFQSFIYPWPLYTATGKWLDDQTYADRDRWERLQRQWYRSGAPYRDLDRIDGTPNPIFDAWLDHPDYDRYWQQLIPYGREFAAIDIPVLVQTGYYDGGMVGALYYLEQHYRYRPDADHRLLVGPYHHIAMQTGVLASVNGEQVDQAALIDLQEVRLDWFDHVFRGAPLPDVLRDRINFQVMGANTWRHVATLEAMATEHRRLYLSGTRDADGLLFSALPVGQVAPTLSVDFKDRRDADLSLPRGVPDTRNALVFRTERLREPLEIDGLFQARLQLVTNKEDFDLQVDFYEQTPEGRYLDLASYLGRASYMQDRTRRHLLRPGRTQMLSFQSQTLTARLLAPGSRIVAVVGVPKRPYVQINYGTGGAVSDESIADAGRPLRIRLMPQSYFELGVREKPADLAPGSATGPASVASDGIRD